MSNKSASLSQKSNICRKPSHHLRSNGNNHNNYHRSIAFNVKHRKRTPASTRTRPPTVASDDALPKTLHSASHQRTTAAAAPKYSKAMAIRIANIERAPIAATGFVCAAICVRARCCTMNCAAVQLSRTVHMLRTAGRSDDACLYTQNT